MLKFISKVTLKKFIRNPLHAIAMGTGKIATHLAASTLRGRSLSPKNLTFFLTYRCNLRCNVCGQWGVTGYVKNASPKLVQDELDIETLKRVIDDIAPSKPHITMCGGEVLLYKDWYEFVRHVKSRGLTCILTTNGTLLESNAEKLVDAGLDKLSLSLDGPERIHNSARGSDTVFQKAIRGIEAVNRYKKQKNKKLPVIEIGCTISDQNYRHLDDVIEIAESLRVSCLIFLHLCFLSEPVLKRQTALFRDLFNTESVHWLGYQYNPRNIDIGYLSKKIEEIKSRRYSMPIIIHPDFNEQEINRYYGETSFLSHTYNNSCLAPWTTVYVLPNGDISPCSSFVAGNVKKGSFRRIWNNEKFTHFRRELAKRKFFPVCPRCCEFYKY